MPEVIRWRYSQEDDLLDLRLRLPRGKVRLYQFIDDQRRGPVYNDRLREPWAELVLGMRVEPGHTARLSFAVFDLTSGELDMVGTALRLFIPTHSAAA